MKGDSEMIRASPFYELQKKSKLNFKKNERFVSIFIKMFLYTIQTICLI